MKSHLILYSLFLILFYGCSKDDDSPKSQEETVIPADEKLLGTINNTISFEYNSDKTVKKFTLDELLFLYTYTSNAKINTMELIGGGDNIIFSFTYDANGFIDSFSSDGVVTDVIYNEVDNKYTYTDDNNEIFNFFLDADGEIKKVHQDDGVEPMSTIFLYNDSNKGPLFNSNNIIVSISIAIPQYSALVLYGITKKPVEQISTSGGLISYENTFDEQGFLTKSIIDIEEEPLIFEYSYIQL